MASRIVAIEERCPHGRTDECGEPICHECSGPYGHAKTCSHAGRGGEGTYPCSGGSRRVLTEGELVDLIDKHTQAIIDGLGIKNVVVAPGMSVALDLGILDLDALAGGES